MKMVFLAKVVIFLLVNTVTIYSNPVTTPASTKKPIAAQQELDAANLETLNRETRKAMLKLVGDELSTARAVMNSIQPDVTNCQKKVDQRYAECVACVDMKCQNRYKECKGSIEIIAPNSGGVSVSSTVNERGKPTTTICTVVWGQSDACTTVMNPDGIFTTSINSMGNNLHVHLRNVATDLGGNVGMFVTQMQNVVGDINSTQMSNEELEAMLAEVNAGLSGMQFELQNMMSGFGQNMQQSMGNMHQSLSQVGPRVQQSLSHVGPNINSMVTQFGPSANNYVSNVNTGVGNMLYNLHQGLGQWSQSFGQSIGNMLSGLFGRKKRQAQINADPSHEVRCDTMVKNSTVCAEYRKKCQSCPQTSNVTEGDVIKLVCGAVIVDKVMQISDKLSELTKIEDTVVSSRKVIDKIEMDKGSWNTDTFTFGKVYVTANIRGKPERFISKSGLQMLNLRATGSTIAKQIWRYWNDHTIAKPI